MIGLGHTNNGHILFTSFILCYSKDLLFQLYISTKFHEVHRAKRLILETCNIYSKL